MWRDSQNTVHFLECVLHVENKLIWRTKMENLENQSQIENDFSSILENIGAQNLDKNMVTKTVNSVQIEPKMEIKSMKNELSWRDIITTTNQVQNEARLNAKIDELSKGDQVTINELYLQLSNTQFPNIATDGFPYTNQLESINKNLIRKVLRGIYDHELAIKLMSYIVDRFNKNEGIKATKTHRVFCAEIMVNDFEYDYETENFSSNLYPK